MDKIKELLTRGVDKIYPSSEELEKILRAGKKLTLYQGFDPTGKELHIGHMVGFRKLRQWQELGHHVIFLIGDGTGQAGDPSGKKTSRGKFLTRDELRANAVDYVKQASRIVRFEGENPVEIKFNSDWLNKLELIDILEIAEHFTLQQLSERDLFQERIRDNQPINLREFLYPLLQGYDSVAMNVDLELGGTDQLFNMLCGRTLLRAMKSKDKFVMTTPLLEDSEGRKIGKTEGNVIALTDKPTNLYGKIMALGDEIIVKGLEYLTDVPTDEITEIEKALAKGEHPVTHKKRLAFEVVRQLHGESEAKKAALEFERTIQNKESPTNIEVYSNSKETNILQVLYLSGLTSSISEGKRLIKQKGIFVDDVLIESPDYEFDITSNHIVRVGRKFRNIIKA